MAYTAVDIARLGPAAQRQILDKVMDLERQKRGKYGNTSTTVNNIRFASAKEAARYQELMLLQKAGRIRNLRLQVDFPITVGWTDPETGECTRPQVYKADFVYEEARRYDDGLTVPYAEKWETVVEDVKGYRTQTYINKKKLVEEKYGIRIRET